MRHRWLLGAALSAWPGLAFAQDSARATAVQLFDEAQLMMKQGDFAHACPKYAASVRLDPQIGALLHLADCYEQNGQLASAWGSFRQAEEMAQGRGDQRAAMAKEYAARLAPRLSRLTLVVREPGRYPSLQLAVDGMPLTPGAWGTPNPIDAGEHRVEARANGYATWSSSVSITRERQYLSLEVPPLEPLPGPRVAVGGAQESDAGKPFPWRTLGWVGVGLGAVGVGLGTYFLVQRGNKLDEREDVCPFMQPSPDAPATYVCDNEDQAQRIHDLTSDARRADTLATVGFIAGGALVAGGVAALLLAPRGSDPSRAAWLAPSLAPEGFGMTGGATW